MEKRNMEDGPAAVWRTTRHVELLRDRMKHRLTDDPSRRNLKIQNLKVPQVPVQEQAVGTRSSSASSLKLGQSSVTASVCRLEETSNVVMKLRQAGDLTLVQSVELEAKETQTKGKWEEKGLQISLGRHVSRAQPVLAMSSSQTDTPAIMERLKEKVQVNTTHFFFYLAVTLFSFFTAFFGFHVGKALWSRPIQQSLKGPTIWKRIFSSIGWVLHTCSYCPSHR